MPGPPGLSHTGPSNEIGLNGKENTYSLMTVRIYIIMYTTNHLFNFVSLQITSSRVVPEAIDPDTHTQCMNTATRRDLINSTSGWQLIILMMLRNGIKNKRITKTRGKTKTRARIQYTSKFLVRYVPTAKSDPTPAQRVSEARVFARE